MAARISSANRLNVAIRKDRRVVVDARRCNSRHLFEGSLTAKRLLVMKNLLCVLCLTFIACSMVSAQEAELPVPQSDDSFFGPLTDVQPQTDRESRYPAYDTPRQLVIRNAARKAAQRRERMAINARFGYSPSRPPSSTVPSMGSPMGPPTAYRIYTPYPGFAWPRPYGRYWLGDVSR